jgi:glycosyltransferase involved in cell wall biosynthesis
MPHRWLATTTLNDNLLRASFIPLLDAHTDMELLLVTDREGAPMERVRYVVPSRLSSKIFGRLLSRWFTLLRVTRKADRVEVFNTVPHLLLAYLPAKLYRKPIDLHMFAGRYELDFADNPSISDNRIVRRLKHPVGLQSFFRRLALKHVDRFFVPGIRTRTFLKELGVAEAKIINLHSAIDVERYAPGEVERNVDVIIVAGMRTVKRPELALQILEQVLKARPESKFVWLGTGELYETVRAKVAASTLKNALTLVGHTDEPWRYYQRSKVFLLNSSSEGMSCACMEAMASGVVPVAADVGDMAEIVRPGQTGVLIQNHNDPSAYVSAILKLLKDEPKRSSYAVIARNLIVQEHSFPAIVQIWQKMTG